MGPGGVCGGLMPNITMPLHMELCRETTVRVVACTNNAFALTAHGQLFQSFIGPGRHG
jgi:hypothetical protein